MPLPINVISLVLLGEGMDESYGDHSDSNSYSDHSLTAALHFSMTVKRVLLFPLSGLIRNLGTFIPAIQALFSARRRLCRLNSLMIAL